MVVAAGVPVTIMIYGNDSDSGALITCTGSGREDVQPMITGEVQKAILGAFSVDVKNTDPPDLGKIEELVRQEFGEKVLQSTMKFIKLSARDLGFPLD